MTVAHRVRTPWTEFARKFKKQHLAMIAAVFVLFLIASAVLAPWLIPFDAEDYFDYDALNAPLHWRTGLVWTHWVAIFLVGS